MDQIPSQSISKSILLVTPLFLIVLAVLHSSSELSYLFILKFINNVAGSADLTFMPTMQPEMSHEYFNRQDLLTSFNLNAQPRQSVEGLNFPLVNSESLQNWINKNKLIKGASPRWLIPTKVGSIDTILIVVNITKEKEIAIIDQTVQNLDGKQIAMEELLSHKLGYDIGDVVSINFQLRNFPNGLKLFQKYQDDSSDEQYKMDGQTNFNEQQLSNMFYNFIKPYADDRINKTEFDKIFKILYQSQINADYTLKQTYYPEGIYPSAISNVMLMEFQGFTNLLTQWITKLIMDVNQQRSVDVKNLLPPQYRDFWPRNQFEARAASELSKPQIQTFFKSYSLLTVCRLNNREEIYKPNSVGKYQQFATMLEETPAKTEVIVIYPFFQQSLAIKYFFDSVIQIFEFVTCIIYFYTMTLIMKQIYEQKQVQVGIWRTLGAGGVSQRKVHPIEVQQQDKPLQSRGSGLKYRSQFEQKMSTKQVFKFYSKLMVKVGYFNYWVVTTVISIFLYFLLKIVFYFAICTKLGFGTISQPFHNLLIIFIAVLAFVLSLVYQHIKRIYTNPLSQTIKPVKRTFDVVKVRVIHVATFGVSMEVLLIAIMLVYYGVVSYYWIPFAVIDGQEDLQVLLFNTIFLFMIFGAIILLGIVQPRIQMAIFSLIFRFNSQMRTMKLAILKNIKAKQYKNIKVTIIISIIFAFVLFFTAGIKIQMQIVQSFIERALGSNLVFENYEKNTFNTTKIDKFLSDKEGIEYSWLSRNLNRDNISISLVSHITGSKITPEIQVLTPEYLNSTFYQYYYPEKYLSDSDSYWKLPNSIFDGFNSIYTGEKGQDSVGHYDPKDTIKQIDPYKVVTASSSDFDTVLMTTVMAPEEQIIKLIVSSDLRKRLGVNVGDQYKLQLSTLQNLNTTYYLRAQITHSFKAGPGFDLLGRKAFISSQQAEYIYRILGAPKDQVLQNEKLFIKGSPEDLKGIGASIITLSPDHTQMFEIQFVSKSFSLLSTYLNAYIVLITGVMSTLVTIFIFLYTLGKCRQEAEMYKMLRAIGLSAKNIRIMVFSQIMIRLIVSILGGILLGVLFSIGFSLQIEEFLMIQTPPMNIGVVSVIGIVLTVIFSITIIRATKYISQKTVAQTNKL